MTAVLNQAEVLNNFDLKNMQLPKEGPRCVPARLPFTGINTSLEIDAGQLYSLGKLSVIQGVFIDNSLSSSTMILQTGIAGQVVVCPPKAQGYFPVFVPNPAKLIATSTYANTQTIYFYNIPIPPCVWSVGSMGFIFDGNGYLLVSDPALDALITASGLLVNTGATALAAANFGQGVIAATGVAQQLPANTGCHLCTIGALATNANPVVAGSSTVTNVFDGTGNGFPINQAFEEDFGCTNTNQLWLNGTIGDVYFYHWN
jgi:hypothetical protein